MRIIFITTILIISCTNKKENKHHPDTPDGMAYIPGGTFNMGGKSEQAEVDEFPIRKIAISAFFMDDGEVTNRQFSEFVEATNYKTMAERTIDWDELQKQLPKGTPKPEDSLFLPGSLVFKSTSGPVDLNDYSQWWTWATGADWRHPEGPNSTIGSRMDHPVVHISIEDAKAYAVWSGKRLPTEAEWEWASMGGIENAKYPWGNEPVDKAYTKANFWQGIFPFKNLGLDGYFSSAPIKSFPSNGYGLYDMAGNVWELCQDKYHNAAYQQSNPSKVITDPKGPKSSYDPREPFAEKYVVRGGSFLCNDSYCSGYRSARRMGVEKSTSSNHTGFRCVKSIKSL